MKNIIKAVACFGLLLVFGNGKVLAALPIAPIKETFEKIETVPIVVTPTNTLINQIDKVIDVDLKPLTTKTPTPVIVTQVVTATPEPIKPTETVNQTKLTEPEKTTITPETTETAAEPTIEEIEKTDGTAEKSSSNNLFWGVIVGLLALILVIQIWSTKKNEEKESKKEE